MNYSNFLQSILEEAETDYPLVFNRNKRNAFLRVSEFAIDQLDEIIETLTDWSWYIPNPFKIARIIMAGGVIAIIVMILRENDLLNRQGILAVKAIAEITQTYRRTFELCNDDAVAIERLRVIVYNELKAKIRVFA